MRPSFRTVSPTLAVALMAAVATTTLSAPLVAQSRHTENTVALDPHTSSPPARASDLAWIVGHWRGPGLGGTADEVWLAPEGGAMAGLFRAVSGGRVLLYEAMTIVEVEGTLVLRLKHFNADLTGWEEKDEVVSFPLVRIETSAVYFDGLTYRKNGDDRLRAYVAVEQEEGAAEEMGFELHRVR